MKSTKVSHTALMTAFERAYHSQNNLPKIFDDYIAGKLLSLEEHSLFEQQFVKLARNLFPDKASIPDQDILKFFIENVTSTADIISRARFTEDCLDNSMEKQNVQQYVILGAGMDTFALRRTDTSSTLRIFELDHPATQSSKRQRISALGTMLPENLHFIPVDFTKEDLTDALKRSEYDPEVPAFFSWLGVTYYLPREVVLSVLSSISDLATAKSNIVFDYYNTDAFIEGKASRRMEGWKNFTRAAGEPIITGFDPSSLAEDIIGTGFSLKENLSPVDIEKLYFLGRSDNYHATEHTYFARAEIV